MLRWGYWDARTPGKHNKNRTNQQNKAYDIHCLQWRTRRDGDSPYFHHRTGITEAKTMRIIIHSDPMATRTSGEM